MSYAVNMQSNNGGTAYDISVETHAFPPACKQRHTDSRRASASSEGGGEEERPGGWLATQVEQFTSNKLLGALSDEWVSEQCIHARGCAGGH